MDNETCNKVFEQARLSVAPSEICAMIKGTTKDSCQGDSGGPLVVSRPRTLRKDISRSAL